MTGPGALERAPGRGAAPVRLAPRVLVAEADERVREALAARLSARGYSVIPVRSGEELVRRIFGPWLFEEPPELLVLGDDVLGTPGLQILARVRGLEWNLPVVLVTRDDEVRATAERMGAAAVLGGGTRPDRVADVVCRLLPAEA